MNRKQKIKRIVKDETIEIAVIGTIMLTGIAAYTFACKQYGFRMVRPTMMTTKGVHAVTITGKQLFCPLIGDIPSE